MQLAVFPLCVLHFSHIVFLRIIVFALTLPPSHNPSDVPKLQPHPGMLDKKDTEEPEEEDLDLPESDDPKTPSAAPKARVQSGPRTPNPYAADNSSLMFPILVAFGVFIPTLFCLCRL